MRKTVRETDSLCVQLALLSPSGGNRRNEGD
jgi:hypothetical protein